MRKIALASLAAVGVLAAAGCSAGGGDAADDEGAELRVWLVGTDTPDEAR